MGEVNGAALPFPGRVRRAADALAARELDALIVVSDPNVTYFSGFHHFKTTKFVGWATALVITGEGRSTLCAPALTLRYAEQRATAHAVVRYDTTPAGLAAIVLQAIAPAPTNRRRLRLGVEGAHLPFNHHQALHEALPMAEWIDATAFIGELRSVKEAVEIDMLRRAATIADEGMRAAAARLGVGRTELEVAAAASGSMLAAGADVVCHCSVKSGLNSALIQSFSSPRRIEASDVVNVDLGAVVGGYCSDLTRTFVVGQPTPLQRNLFALSLQALEAAAGAARPDARGDAVDAAARGLFTLAGYEGDAFPHLTGHGIGVEVHEPPILAPRSIDILRAGTVLCLEPGLYDIQAGGIRTEDMFLLTASGVERLTVFPRDLTWR